MHTRDVERIDSHIQAIGQILAEDRRYIMHVSGDGTVSTMSLWSGLAYEDRKAITLASMPIPGLLVAKLVFGLSWPVAAAVGLVSAPVLMWVLAQIHAHDAATLTPAAT